MNEMIDWLLSFEWFREALIARGWSPPVVPNAGGGPPKPP